MLLLGPLCPLQERSDRLLALTEALWSVWPEGLVAAAGINRYASLFGNPANGLLARPRVQAAIRRIVDTWHMDGTSVLTTAYFHTGAEFEAELLASGLSDVTVHGDEGPAWSLLKASEQHSGESLVDSLMFTAAPAAARIADEHSGRLVANSHFLATARRPSGERTDVSAPGERWCGHARSGSQPSGRSDRRATRAAPRCWRSRGRVGDRPVRVVMRRSR